MAKHKALRAYIRPLSIAAVLTVAVGAMGLTSLSGTASAASSSGCGRSAGLASGTHTIQSSGKNRSYILKVPDSYNSNYPHRLAFGFHWRGGTAQQVAGGGTDGYSWAYYGMASQAGNSTIFVAPQGLNGGWGNSGGEDITFTDDMIRQIQSNLCVDTTQLFSVGFSYGGGMSYALACARATVFRAVAVIAGAQLSGCSGGTQPIAYLGIHGINDGTLNISNGRTLRNRFVANNGCTSQSPREPSSGSLTHITTAYSGCRSGYPVVWAAFDGGHQQGPVDGCAGCESGARSWVKPEIWKFFSQFSSGTPTTTTTTTSRSTTTTTTSSSSTTTSSSSTTSTATSTTGGGGGCTATVGRVDQWQGGFVASIDVTAGSSSISGWRVGVTLPSGAAYSNGWNASFSGTSGTIQASNVSYNGSVGAGQSATFGFQGTGTASGMTVSCVRQ